MKGDSLKPVRGKSLPLQIQPLWSSEQLLAAAIKKLKDFNQDIEDAPRVLLYPDAKEDKVGARVIYECKKAAEWVETNQHLFSDKVELPSVITVGEEELAEAVQQYDRLRVEDESSMVNDMEKDAILEPFKFKFYKMEDMWIVCEETADKQGYLAYTDCDIED
ncbi:hypothetical protein ABVT39_024791 [Epinephelus coioides]